MKKIIMASYDGPSTKEEIFLDQFYDDLRHYISGEATIFTDAEIENDTLIMTIDDHPDLKYKYPIDQIPTDPKARKKYADEEADKIVDEVLYGDEAVVDPTEALMREFILMEHAISQGILKVGANLNPVFKWVDANVDSLTSLGTDEDKEAAKDLVYGDMENLVYIAMACACEGENVPDTRNRDAAEVYQGEYAGKHWMAALEDITDESSSGVQGLLKEARRNTQ